MEHKTSIEQKFQELNLKINRDIEIKKQETQKNKYRKTQIIPNDYFVAKNEINSKLPYTL